MKYLKLFFWVLFIFYVWCSYAWAQDFSADIVSTADRKSFRAKIFVSQDKVRIETDGAVNIVRPDRNLVWAVIPEQKLYMELPLDSKNMVIGTTKIPNEETRELVGKDNIGGKTTSKYRVVYESGEKKETVYIWILEGLDIPVKTESADGSWKIEYKNILINKVSPKLFDIPSSYQKLSANSPNLPGVSSMSDK